jgi:hypothetical protein
LVNRGSQLNLISKTFVNEQKLKLVSIPELLAEAANSLEILIYSITTADVTITDSRGRKETHVVPFVVADLRRYQMYLGLPWIDAEDPKLNYAQRRLYLRGKKAKDYSTFRQFDIEDAETFEKTMRERTSDVYACMVGFVGKNAVEQPIMGQMPPQYAEFSDVASEDNARILAEHAPHDLAIEIIPGSQPPHRPLYNLSATELELLRKYVTEYLSRGWIRRSKSPAGAPILFAKKKDGGMRLCVDYRGLNKITLKNRHPLPLITESLERLAQAKVYTKLDVREAYHT